MKILAVLMVFIFAYCLSAQDDPWQTLYERSSCTETPRYTETMEYCQMLADSSDMICFSSFGISPQGRKLPVVVIDKEGLPLERGCIGDKAPVRAGGRLVCMIVSCIHPGESDGKDAMMMLARDIAISKKLAHLLENVSIIWIPIFNVDGHERFGPHNRINQNGPKEMGWRVTARNLNLNRDFLKADSREMFWFMNLFNQIDPEFFIDCHTTDGADYQYPLTWGLEIYGNMDTALTRWQKDEYLPVMEKKMEAAGYPIFKYVYFRRWHDPRSGLMGGVAPPMISEGYTARRNRPGLLIETHMLKDYETRVQSTYEMIKHTLEFLNKDFETLQKLVKEADERTASAEFRSKKFPVRWKTGTEDSVMIEFRGVEYEVVESDLTGGMWFKYSGEPKTFTIPFFDNAEPAVEVHLPEAYIIPAEWPEVINKLRIHGIHFQLLQDPAEIKIKTYKFTDRKFAEGPYEGRFRVVNHDYDEIEEMRLFHQGSAVVPMGQPLARVVAYLLEPKAEGSLLEWGFFNSIFEQKEYSESYVMEEMAREMIAKDPDLKKRFEEKKAADEEFAKSPRQQLNWFYRQTPYWDDRKDIYPVGKVFDKVRTDQLLRR